MLAFPLTKIPMGHQNSQVVAFVYFEFPECRLQTILDRFRRDMQSCPNLTIGIAQTYQCSDILFTGGKRFPRVPESFIGCVLSQTCGQDIGDQIVFRTAFVRGQGGKRDLQAFTRIKAISSRTGRWAQAYQVQKTIPDRHTAGIITEQMFFRQAWVLRWSEKQITPANLQTSLGMVTVMDRTNKHSK